MAFKKVTGDKLRTPRAIISFPHLFAPYLSEDDRKLGRKPKFSASLLFDATAQASPEWAAIKAEANRVAREAFGDELQAMVADGRFNSPFINGDKFAAKQPECAGKIVLRLNSTVKPGVVGPDVMPIVDETKIYPGAIVMVSINCYSYFPDSNRPMIKHGVSFGLGNVQLVDGTTPPLGNRTRPEDDFVPLAAAAGAEVNKDPGAMF